jgi:6-phospho-beta-glucosidase
MREFLGERVVGICDTPIGLVRRVSGVLGIPLGQGSDGVEYDYVGLNHLGWLRSFTVDGVDLLPGLLADDGLLDRIEEARVVGKDFVRATGAWGVPGPPAGVVLRPDRRGGVATGRLAGDAART